MTEPRNYELGKSIKTRLLKLGRLRSLSVGFHELFVPRSAPLITLCMLERNWSSFLPQDENALLRHVGAVSKLLEGPFFTFEQQMGSEIME